MKENNFDQKTSSFKPNRCAHVKIASTQEKVNSIGGLIFSGRIFKWFELNSLLNYRNINRRSDRINDIELCHAMMGLLSQGRSNFEDIELFKNDIMFKEALELSGIPCASSLRTRLNDLGNDTEVIKSLKQGNFSFLTQATAHTIDTGSRNLIPIDIDVSPFDNSNSKKENVGRTYKGHDGYGT